MDASEVILNAAGALDALGVMDNRKGGREWDDLRRFRILAPAIAARIEEDAALLRAAAQGVRLPDWCGTYEQYNAILRYRG